MSKPYSNKLAAGSRQWYAWLEDLIAARKHSKPSQTASEPTITTVGTPVRHRFNKTRAKVLMVSPDKTTLQFEGSFNTKTYSDDELARWYVVL
jgi:hypothetical protein